MIPQNPAGTHARPAEDRRPMIRVSGVSKSFGKLRAVDGLSFEVGPGEILGLLGPNGAGKSTTIGMICGLLTPDAGAVTVGDRPPSEPGARASLGVAPQELAVYEQLSANENLRFFGTLYGLRGAALQQRVDELLEFVSLSDRASDRAGGFSGGMLRRLNLACALMHDPEVILLDEPTAGVDPQSRNRLYELVERLREMGRAILYTTHYMEEAQRLCDRVGVIDRGAMLEMGSVEELVSAHGGPATVVIETPRGEERRHTEEPLKEIEAALATGDALGVRIERASLESVFLNLTGRSLRDG